MKKVKSSFLLFTLPLCTISSLAPFTTAVAQQVTTDGTVSTTVTTPDGKNFNINDGTTRGTNLFHSFKEFSVPTGGSANFNNAANIQNIINRVTGGSISNIDGFIKANGAANLFLLNPAGIVFGPNARLQIGGSFFATTANSFVFDNGYEFSATDPLSPPLLTINIPIGLRFRDNPGAIRVQGEGNNLNFNPEFLEFNRGETAPNGLAVEPGKTLALVGGGVTLEGGNLIADGGRIEVGSVGGSSLVSLTPVDDSWKLGYSGVSSFQDIQLSQKASIDTSSYKSEGAGSIQVQGRNVTVTDGSAIFAFTNSKPGGTVSVNASDLIEVTGVSANDDSLLPSTLYTAVFPEATGTGGDLILNTKQLIAQGGAQIGADTYGVGTAGNIVVKASESVELQGTSADGIQTALGTFVQANATGGGAKLTVETRRLRVQDGALLVTATLSDGTAADIFIKASESTELIGPKSALSSSVGLKDLEAKGDGGIIILETPQLVIRDEATVTVSSLFETSGSAGEFRVTSDSIRLENQGRIEATSESGNGGNINLQAQDFLLMRNNSSISANAGTNEGGGGNGGNITINAPFIVSFPENNDITADAFSGSGGNITINTQGLFGIAPLSRQELEQRLNTTNPTELNPRNLPSSDITAISRNNPNLSGTISINTPETDPSRGLFEFPETVIDPAQQIAQNPCLRGGSEFIITGRGGFPSHPNQILSSDNVRVDLVKPVASQGNVTSATHKQPSTNPTDKPIVPAQGWIFNEKGEVTLVAYDPTKTGPQRSSPTPASRCAVR
ncbi:MAG: filamentous hemagglutinin N-terminal domain-containing protein [Scytonema sp. RU_4_4]|nr:filamentous hemagglutinin N-terminal domain-containing protein [Scytonema sp. RU_4_4]